MTWRIVLIQEIIMGVIKRFLSAFLLALFVLAVVGCPEPPVPEYFTVTFDSDGGSEVESQSILSGDMAREPEIPTKTGYVFANWYSGNSLYDFSTPVTTDVVLTAKWWQPAGFVTVEGATVNGAVGTGNTASQVFVADGSITIPNLFVCDHEVTQEEYKLIMGTNPSYWNGLAGRETPEGENQEKRPVEQVSWYAAIVYCNKLSIALGYDPCYAIAGKTNPVEWGEIPTESNDAWNNVTCDFEKSGFRLPKEAEWEYVARGGSAGIAGTQTVYSGSDNYDDVAWCKYNSGDNNTDENRKLHEVKKKNANALEIYDMSGNVSEWCWDRWTNPLANPNPSYGPKHVTRGGNYDYDAGTSQINTRSEYLSMDAFAKDKLIGFRVVRTAQ